MGVSAKDPGEMSAAHAPDSGRTASDPRQTCGGNKDRPMTTWQPLTFPAERIHVNVHSETDPEVSPQIIIACQLNDPGKAGGLPR